MQKLRARLKEVAEKVWVDEKIDPSAAKAAFTRKQL
jgi:hypothetical protein